MAPLDTLMYDDQPDVFLHAIAPALESHRGLPARNVGLNALSSNPLAMYWQVISQATDDALRQSGNRAYAEATTKNTVLTAKLDSWRCVLHLIHSYCHLI